ncbi:glycoside hydrolase family 127 protein [Novipirellula sp. SH528]|uniref:glycoside hydrolase family 127 protein n=1 Tax=Novipirellula sp. SH528 TaxID=3454466 RepID=UPI003FA0C3B5
MTLPIKQLVFVFCGLVFSTQLQAQQQGIVNTSDSPHVVLKSIDIGDCQWTAGFWADKFKQCETVMMPHMGSLLKGDTGFAYDNFKIAAGLKEGKHQGMHWHDGDFYKWMESAVYVYAINKDEKILNELDEIIAVIAKAQSDDGYLSTQITLNNRERFSKRQYHELYNSGHLLMSACIHHRVTGKTNFLDIAVKHADLLYKTFQSRPAELARFGVNPSQITGLVELYRTTKDPRYLELAGVFVDMRGSRRESGLAAVNADFSGDANQDRVPLRKETEAVGHAVMAMYLYAGAADVYAETGEDALLNALEQIWSNVVEQKMYVTGAIGQAHHGASSRRDFVHEGFIDGYMMPNSTAYNETCANICNAMFNWRMLGIKGESKYADVMELVLYNSGLSGISADGKHYFYTNPLRRTRDTKLGTTDYAERAAYIPCFCCPPNLVRTIAKLSGWAYSLSEGGVAVNLYGGNTLRTKLRDGSELHLKQETQYPWDGAVTITIQACKETPFEMMLRIPGWAKGSKLLINGEAAGVDPIAGTYAKITRTWTPGDIVTLQMPMEARMLLGHPRIEEVRNQAAIQRGPVVYCIESPDLPRDASILDVYLPADIQLKPQKTPQFSDGLTVLRGEVLLKTDQRDVMYPAFEQPNWIKHPTQFIPYYAWSNRGKAEMTVWMPIVWGDIENKSVK